MGAGNSKTEFRSSVNRLLEGKVPWTDNAFWSHLIELPTNTEFVFSLIPPDDIRKLKRSHPENLATFVNKLVAFMGEQAAATTAPVSADQQKILNCVRLLTRLLPFCFEDPADGFVNDVFWLDKIPRAAAAAADAAGGQQEEDSEIQVVDEATGSQPPLAKRLIDCLVSLAFLPGFTVHAAATADKGLGGLEQLWYPGIGSKAVKAPTTTMESNRTEIVRCLLVCFSEPIYRTPEDNVGFQNKWLSAMTAPDSKSSMVLFYSLLNAVFTYDPVGWGLPYSALIVSDAREPLVDVSIQLLVVLLDYRTQAEIDFAVASQQPPQAREVGSDGSTRSSSAPPAALTQAQMNIFRFLLSDAKEDSDFAIIFSGLSRLINNPVEANNTYLPSSTKAIGCYQELLVVFWKAAELNKAFLKFALTRCNVNEIVVPTLFYLCEGRKDLSKIGLIHVGVFILLLLSGERSFAVQLNKTFDGRPPPDLPVFYGSHADLLILVLHKLMVNGQDRLDSLYDCFLTVIVNISPYCKTLSMVTSSKLLSLFEMFASPKFIYASEHNHHYVFFLLEAFNNIVQYQSEGNAYLIYAIIRRAALFRELAAVPEELPEIVQKRIRRLRGESSASLPANGAEGSSDANAANGAPPADAEQSGSARSTNTFVPTLTWIESWKKRLPAQTILRLIESLQPQVQEVCDQAYGAAGEAKVLQFLKGTTLVGLLPVPHPVLIRKYQPNEQTNLWFSTFLWGVIYIRNQSPPIFYGTSVKLFTVSLVEVNK